MRGFIVLVSLMTCSLCQEPPRIRVDVNLVNVAFTARDIQGALAAGLALDDFEVFEDAILQKISFFARSANVPPALGLIVDASGSQEHFVNAHRSHLEAFLHEVLGPQYRAFLVCFGNHLRLVSDLSSSIALLMEGLERFDHGDRGFPELAADGPSLCLATAKTIPVRTT